MTVYGDTFYRVRPFDVPTLAKDSDEIMVMAYDFHKASGNPGPNFPFTGKETYGYDFKSMVDDFRKVVPSNKLTVVFGYFGYDWQTDEKGVASGSAEPLVDTEITQHFLPSCHSCVMTRDPLSGENKVTYTNTDATPHILWFEDATSVKAKQAYLQSQGITSFSDWAYSYF